MSDGDPRPESLRALIPGFSSKDQLDGLALHAIVRAADAEGAARLRDVAAYYRDDYLHALRMKGGNAEREAGRLGQDEVRGYLIASILPRLAESGVIAPLDGDLERDAATVRISPNLWKDIAPRRAEFAEAMRETGEHSRVALSTPPRPALIGGSVLEAQGLTKVYRGRKVVNDVALRLQQGEIVGLLGPNGAGKTTTFYMIVGLIQPDAGRILLDGQDISKLPMYERARRGIGYLSQEPSIFRKLSVEDNILAILETLPLSFSERSERLEKLLDELSIKRLRKSKAYALSGGERRRLEITRALVTDPKFMMLDEPFAGVDPIAVHDIQTIVAGLRHRGIGVLISDHNVEQTLDIVDRAYIMFDGQVKVSGTVRELVFDDTVADIYLGPTLTARLRERFAGDKDEVTVS
ncbi:MAG TPA: LPS export ABC transporter ATP-binding protein [Gemmatimonadaceae bacterium]|jgi:lipopolysaccharide export system ATP-binding protein|nr:LPS export ABC transporter ATP-binding protein [Gemmatimonadaceae bacterium]